jgi:hypothetical protein
VQYRGRQPTPSGHDADLSKPTSSRRRKANGRLHHAFERVENLAGLLGIAVGEQLSRVSLCRPARLDSGRALLGFASIRGRCSVRAVASILHFSSDGGRKFGRRGAVRAHELLGGAWRAMGSASRSCPRDATIRGPAAPRRSAASSGPPRRSASPSGSELCGRSRRRSSRPWRRSPRTCARPPAATPPAR